MMDGMTDQLWITGDPDADALLSDDAFALLVGMLLDQQYPMEHAFAGPRKIRDRLGSIDPRAVAEADPDAFVTLATTPPAIHRYGRSMAARVQDLARVVVDEYDGDATRIWTAPGADGAPTGAEVLARLRGELGRWIEQSNDQGRTPEPPEIVEHWERTQQRNYEQRMKKARER